MTSYLTLACLRYQTNGRSTAFTSIAFAWALSNASQTTSAFFTSESTFSEFIFTAWVSQNGEEIFGCYIEDDGLETVKNQWRQDIKGRWEEIENYRINAIKKQKDEKYHTDQRINPNENLSYQMPKKEFEITEEDFTKTVMDYLMFEAGIDVKEFKDDLINKVMYQSEVEKKEDKVFISLKGKNENE